MNAQLVKLWIQSEISKLRYRIDLGMERQDAGEAKIEVLEYFAHSFNLDDIEIKIKVHDDI